MITGKRYLEKNTGKNKMVTHDVLERFPKSIEGEVVINEDLNSLQNIVEEQLDDTALGQLHPLVEHNPQHPLIEEPNVTNYNDKHNEDPVPVDYKYVPQAKIISLPGEDGDNSNEDAQKNNEKSAKADDFVLPKKYVTSRPSSIEYIDNKDTKEVDQENVKNYKISAEANDFVLPKKYITSRPANFEYMDDNSYAEGNFFAFIVVCK